jgi:hypothetical protein
VLLSHDGIRMVVENFVYTNYVSLNLFILMFILNYSYLVFFFF